MVNYLYDINQVYERERLFHDSNGNFNVSNELQELYNRR
jgi:hypothetical protein